MLNSTFAFPRLPPSINHPLGLSKTSKLKDDVIKDNASMINQLNDFNSKHRQHVARLFDLSPGFSPGHPLHFISTNDTIQLENEQLKKENIALKRDLEKFKKK